MNNGYVKFYRKCLWDGWLRNRDLWTFWSYCLFKASYKKWTTVVGYQQVELEPGQFIFGRRIASSELEMSERTIRTCLKNLKNMKNLTIKATSKYSIVTILNWESYQGQENESDQQSDQRVTSKRPASDHIQELKELKEGKEGKELKKKKEKTLSADADGFDEFYKLYPRHEAKEPGRKAWKKLSQAEKALALKGLKKWLEYDWFSPEDKFIPLPASWLNAKRWTDEKREAPDPFAKYRQGE